MSKQEIIETIQSWFVENTGGPFDVNAEYMTSGVVDSFSTIDLITFMESSFAIQFSSDDFQRPEFTTIAGLAEMIGAKATCG